jgi:hypothetical protein
MLSNKLQGDILMLIKIFNRVRNGFNYDYAYSLLFGMLGTIIVLMSLKLIQPESKQMVSVDIIKIINEFSVEEAHRNISDDIRKKHVKDFGQKLEMTMKTLAGTQHLIILPAEAVFAGCKDYTDIVIHQLKN